MTKFRWSKVYESSEEELLVFLQAHKIHSIRVYVKYEDESIEHFAEKDITIWCAEGSLAVNADSDTKYLQAGDALRIQQNTKYTINPGIADCSYYLS